MDDENDNELAEMRHTIADMQRQINELKVANIDRQAIALWEGAHRKAAAFYLIRLAESMGIKDTPEVLEEATKKVYADMMDEIRESDPEMAAKLDIRASMPESERDDWYLVWLKHKL